jgi:hypothetical protein
VWVIASPHAVGENAMMVARTPRDAFAARVISSHKFVVRRSSIGYNRVDHSHALKQLTC